VDLQSLKIERAPAATTSTRRRRNPWLVRGAMLAVLVALGWLFLPQLSAFVDRVRLPVVRTFVVAEAAAAATAAVRGTAANGYIVAARRAALSSDVPGRIVELNVREGSVVKEGDVVARLYADEFRQALRRAEAEFATAASQVLRAEAAAKAAAADVAEAAARVASAGAQRQEAAALSAWSEAELRRIAELLTTGIGSARDVERATSERDAAQARERAAEAVATAAATAAEASQQRERVAAAEIVVANAQVDAARAARDLAQATLDKTDVRAPFAGIVVLKDAEVGEVVSPNVVGGSTARGAVCTMVDFDSLEVQANVPETTLASVQIGAPADVFLDAFPDERYPGIVDRIWPTADRSKATVEVRVRLERKDERLRPEMGVRIVFASADDAAPSATSVAPARSAIVVPEETLVAIDGRTGAFVVERDVVRFLPVTAGERRNGRVVILAGLVPDQRLVLSPPPSLQTGDRVRLQDH
jgi:RND family efflux transporter MFP subunit